RDFHVTGVQTCALPIWAVDPGHALLLVGRRRGRGLVARRVVLDVLGDLARAARAALRLLVLRRDPELADAEVGVLPHQHPRRRRSEERRVGQAWSTAGT